MKQARPLWIIMVLLIAACGGSSSSPDVASADPPAVADLVTVEEAASVDAETEAVAETVEETIVEVEESVREIAADIGPPPALSTELKATNPDNVVLSNGQPQVVEFFAFW